MIFEFSRNFFRKYAENVEACSIERILLTRRSFEMCGIRLLPSYLQTYIVLSFVWDNQPYFKQASIYI